MKKTISLGKRNISNAGSKKEWNTISSVNTKALLKNKNIISVPKICASNPGMAIWLSLVVPGAGHMYKGDAKSGLKWFIIVPLGYFLFIVPGLIMHMISIVKAGRMGHTANTAY